MPFSMRQHQAPGEVGLALLEAKRAAFWSTLLSLGFDPNSACTGIYAGVELGPDVFTKSIYHVKAAELFLHFLLSLLDPQRARQTFLDCWPVCEPRQSRDFRTASFKWLDQERKQTLEDKTGRWPIAVPIRRSYFDECRGERFENVMWALVVFVAEHLLVKDLKSFAS
ncbi:hypothetical protein EV182_003538, partial [Spiromyces aspiralis]